MSDTDEMFLYSSPITFATITITSSADYLANREMIHDIFRDVGMEEDDIQEADDSLGPDGDTDLADEFVDYLDTLGVDFTGSLAQVQINETQFLNTGFSISDPQLQEAASSLDTIRKEFSLESLGKPSNDDGVMVSDYQPDVQASVSLQPGLMPPRPPLCMPMEGPIAALRFCRRRESRSFRLRSHLVWGDIVNAHVDPDVQLHSEAHFTQGMRRRTSDAAAELNSSSSLSELSELMSTEDRSNSRPKGGIVMAVMSTGELHNVGSHSFRLRSDVEFPLKLDKIDLALCEFFSAPGGEGLACATGSHSLHQIVSALLSASLESAGTSVSNEEERQDITITDGALSYDIDITSTIGIWHKLKSRRPICAISKYDIAALLIRSLTGNPARCLSYSILCALAIEHNTYYVGADLTTIPRDLRIQYLIYQRLSRSSQRSVDEIMDMSYHAVIHEAVKDMQAIDFHEQGRTYKEKAHVLIDGIHKLDHDKRIAVPPFPVTEISCLPPQSFRICIAGQDLMVPSSAFRTKSSGTGFTPLNNDDFLREYPATGITDFDDAMDICRILQDALLPSYGMTHRGPEVSSEDVKNQIWTSTGDIYASSAVAQFCEIRADVVRAIDTSPASNTQKWRTCVIYKGKVLLYYRIRDPVVDARGYRIDWFAISSFETLGSKEIKLEDGDTVYLWPRQRMRSQEMEIAAMAPRRLKLTLFSMLDKVRQSGATIEKVMYAWQKLAMTACSATWASGANYITCRHISSSLCSPAPPFDSMLKKFKPARTFACCIYFSSLLHALESWHTRGQYHERAAILDLPRHYSQLEAYWQVWVPDELADPNKHYADCILGLYDEYCEQEACEDIRCEDLLSQLALLQQSEISFLDICESVRSSCTLNTGGKFGWSVFGSLASAAALCKEGSPKGFDRSFSRGGKARSLVDHLSVRHSAMINKRGKLKSGTVAENILESGVDSYLSVLEPAARFFYGRLPVFINHPKNGEHKDREISITDPDSRIMLNDAEHICGEYGRHTNIDMLKRPDKDAHFYKICAEAVTSGGIIQASDASRFAAMMSNTAVAISCLGLAAKGGSAHLLSSSSTYSRLAFRRMAVDDSFLEQMDKRITEQRSPECTKYFAQARRWVSKMPKIAHTDTGYVRSYTTACHTGQGMSHVGMSLEHGGALLLSIHAAQHAKIIVSRSNVKISSIPLVTSDDSTIVTSVYDPNHTCGLDRAERQKACQLFLRCQRSARKICLRSVSVMPNLSKEKTSGICGEFNSQDNGIGVACPLLGFREAICQLTRPCAPSLIGDLLNAHAYGKTIALSGQGLMTGAIGHGLYLDAVMQRWSITSSELECLTQSPLIPEAIIKGSNINTVLRTPQSMLPLSVRSRMMQMSYNHHTDDENYDPEVQETAFGPLSHIKIAMKRQHMQALKVLKEQSGLLKSEGHELQAMLLEQSIRATLSSARTRGAGRIAQRIRGKTVRPRPYAGNEFSRGPILETTLTWLEYLNQSVEVVKVDSEVEGLARIYGSMLVVDKISASRFPQPATKRKSRSPGIWKPRYVLDTYGKTPFGRHALLRSHATLVKEFGPDQKRQMSLYHAANAYRNVPEHTQYGGKFPIDWVEATSGTLVARTIAEDIDVGTRVPIFWGDMSEECISFLRDVEQDHEDIPVLALSFFTAGKAYYHGTCYGRPYSATIVRDMEAMVPRSYDYVTTTGGQEVCAVTQGWTSKKLWYGTGPTGSEIHDYQHESFVDHPNVDVDATYMGLSGKETAPMPLAATLLGTSTIPELVAIYIKITKQCPKSLVPYVRAQFLGCLATGGYWYTALKGVQVRAFLKGHYGQWNCWTNAVLGWRMSITSDPEYGWEPPDTGTVRSMAIVGGIDTDQHVSVLNPVDFAQADCYVDRSGIHRVSKITYIEYSKENLTLIRRCNSGDLLFNSSQGKAQLIDSELPAMAAVEMEKMDSDYKSDLFDLVYGVQDSIFNDFE